MAKSKSKVAQMSGDAKVAIPEDSTQKNDAVQDLLKEVKSLRAEINSLEEEVKKKPESAYGENRSEQRRKQSKGNFWGCQACRQQGKGESCSHC